MTDELHNAQQAEGAEEGAHTGFAGEPLADRKTPPQAAPPPAPAAADPAGGVPQTPQAGDPGAHAMYVDLNGCARCHGGPHPGLYFAPLTYPVPDAEGDFTHFALCPVNSQPILLRTTDVEQATTKVEPDEGTV